MELIVEERTCSVSGLRLFRYDALEGVQVSKTQYGGLSGRPRYEGEDVTLWNRWDSPRSTYYYARSARTAFAEVLAPFRRPPGVADPLVGSAARFGVPVEEFIELVECDRGEDGFLDTGTLPASWRTQRSIFTAVLPVAGWWVDIEHIDTMAALDRTLSPGYLEALGVDGGLDISDITGRDRRLTTLLAAIVRDTTVEDAGRPLGIQYTSRRDGGMCWAVFGASDEAISVGPGLNGITEIVTTRRLPVAAPAGRPIERGDPTLRSVADTYGLTIL